LHPHTMSLIERLSLLHRLTLCMAESRTHNLHVPFLAYPVDTPIMALVPPVILFLASQRFFMRGIVVTSVDK